MIEDPFFRMLRNLIVSMYQVGAKPTHRCSFVFDGENWSFDIEGNGESGGSSSSSMRELQHDVREMLDAKVSKSKVQPR